MIKKSLAIILLMFISCTNTSNITYYKISDDYKKSSEVVDTSREKVSHVEDIPVVNEVRSDVKTDIVKMSSNQFFEILILLSCIFVLLLLLIGGIILAIWRYKKQKE